MGRRKEPTPHDSRFVRKLQKQRQYWKNQCALLRRRLAEVQARKVAGRIESIWFVRVAFADPKISMQSLESFCRDFPEDKAISKSYIGPVRDAFCEIIKKISRQALATSVSLFSASGLWSKDQERKESIPLWCCHIHDEALMRMRSFTPLSVDRLVTGRSSKIQTHVVTLRQTDFLQEFFSELIPLACKDADTICQSLIDVVIEIYQSISCASSDNWEQLRFVHLLTSDSVSANLAAAKRLWASLGPLKRKNGSRVRYSLLFWVCSSHQANLVTQTAIQGRRRNDENEQITANCSRLFRHLIPDYTEEFAQSLFSFLDREMSVLPSLGNEDRSAGYRLSCDLQRLYGEDALPCAVMDIFNGNLTEHVHVQAGGDIRDRAAIVAWAFRELNKLLICCEEKPVITRFWLFGSCVCKLWLMQALGLPSAVFQTTTTRPREENLKRLRRFQQFYNSAESRQSLRRAVLCLRLTNYAVNISSQKTQSTEKPLLVRLGQGEVQDKTERLFQTLVRRLHLDSNLDISDAFEGLLLTQSHILIRYQKYLEYPTKLWSLAACFNPTGYISAIEDFLNLTTTRS